MIDHSCGPGCNQHADVKLTSDTSGADLFENHASSKDPSPTGSFQSKLRDAFASSAEVVRDLLNGSSFSGSIGAHDATHLNSNTAGAPSTQNHSVSPVQAGVEQVIVSLPPSANEPAPSVTTAGISNNSLGSNSYANDLGTRSANELLQFTSTQLTTTRSPEQTANYEQRAPQNQAGITREMAENSSATAKLQKIDPSPSQSQADREDPKASSPNYKAAKQVAAERQTSEPRSRDDLAQKPSKDSGITHESVRIEARPASKSAAKQDHSDKPTNPERNPPQKTPEPPKPSPQPTQRYMGWASERLNAQVSQSTPVVVTERSRSNTTSATAPGWNRSSGESRVERPTRVNQVESNLGRDSTGNRSAVNSSLTSSRATSNDPSSAIGLNRVIANNVDSARSIAVVNRNSAPSAPNTQPHPTSARATGAQTHPSQSPVSKGRDSSSDRSTGVALDRRRVNLDTSRQAATERLKLQTLVRLHRMVSRLPKPTNGLDQLNQMLKLELASRILESLDSEEYQGVSQLRNRSRIGAQREALLRKLRRSLKTTTELSKKRAKDGDQTASRSSKAPATVASGKLAAGQKAAPIAASTASKTGPSKSLDIFQSKPDDDDPDRFSDERL